MPLWNRRYKQFWLFINWSKFIKGWYVHELKGIVMISRWLLYHYYFDTIILTLLFEHYYYTTTILTLLFGVYFLYIWETWIWLHYNWKTLYWVFSVLLMVNYVILWLSDSTNCIKLDFVKLYPWQYPERCA